MARLTELARVGHGAHSPTGSAMRWKIPLIVFAAMLLKAAPVRGQNQQYIYISSPTPGGISAQQTLSGFLLDPVKGTLTLVAGSPFPEGRDPEQMAIHPTGKFLFVVNSSSGTNNVSVFQINLSTGTLTENSKSPFSAGGGSMPQVVVSEPTGRYLYVGNFASSDPAVPKTSGVLNSYVIDQTTGDLTPTTATTNECGPVCSTMPVNPVGLVADPTGKRVYAYGGTNSALGLNGAALQEYTIDSATGNVVPSSGGGTGTFARCLAMDPKGRFLFSGRGQAQGFIDSNPISSVDGSLQPPVSLSLGSSSLPDSLAVDNGGNFLYAVIAGSLRGFTIDQTTGTLTEMPGSPFGVAATTIQSVVTDPIGPFLFAMSNGVEGFQIGSGGGLTPVAGSPFFSNLGGVAIVMTGATPVQPVSGPVAKVTPAMLGFGDVTVGTPNGPKPVQLTNVGNEKLAIVTNGISISGPNGNEFTPQSQCPPLLDVAMSCTINVTFTPATTGMQQATLFISDNAPGSPQQVPLTGNGVPPLPGVTLMPGSLTFPDTAAGDSSVPKIITLTNSGQATLMFSGTGISLMGSDPGDFTATNTCGTSLAASANCTITVTFKPIATGARTATLNIVDNAPGSPQTPSLSGNGDAPFAVLPASGGSTTATVNAGQTAQYNLQVTPSASFSGSVTLQCSGAPTAAVCTASPSPLQVTAGTPAPFAVSVTTTSRGNSQFPAPLAGPGRWDSLRFLPQPWLLLAALVALLLFFRGARTNSEAGRRSAYSRAALVTALWGILFVSGCGGGSTMTLPPPPPPPPPPGTPAGTYQLMVTATSGNTTQILDLTMKVN
jgi:hypothetical protein